MNKSLSIASDGKVVYLLIAAPKWHYRKHRVLHPAATAEPEFAMLQNINGRP